MANRVRPVPTNSSTVDSSGTAHRNVRGLLSSVIDLTRFYHSLFTGRVFEKSATLDTILQIPSLESPSEYAMGIEREVVGDVTYWGHRGYWGTDCFHAPAIDLTFARTRNVHDVPEGYDGSRLMWLLTELFTS